MEKDKKIKGLLELITYEATNEGRALLKKYNQAPAKNHADLEYKLAILHRDADDRIAIEKEFCAIHPHRNFILKYTELDKKPETVVEAPNGAVLTEDKIRQIMREYINEPKDNFSNCAGNPNCNCGSSSFEGAGYGKPGRAANNLETIGVIGLITVAIVGLLVYSKKINMKVIAQKDIPVLTPNIEHKNFTETDIFIPMGTEIEGEFKAVKGERKGKPFTYRLFYTNKDQIIYINNLKPANMQRTEVTLSAEGPSADSPKSAIINIPKNLVDRNALYGIAFGAAAGFGFSAYKQKSTKEKLMWTITGAIVGFAAAKIITKKRDITVKK